MTSNVYGEASIACAMITPSPMSTTPTSARALENCAEAIELSVGAMREAINKHRADDCTGYASALRDSAAAFRDVCEAVSPEIDDEEESP